MAERPQIAVYYFPNYHPDARNAQVHGPGWTEWELVKRAEPRFAGHDQPRVPLWGYEDEADARVMAKKIDAAAEHGVDAFIFDWYWYADGPFLQRGLEEGFLGAANNQRMKFAIMWANHTWVHIHPATRQACRSHSNPVLYRGPLDRAGFDALVEHTIETYFKHPAYLTIDGAPYYSIYDLSALVEGLGGVEETRAALADFRARTRAAGFPDLHLNQVLWNTGILPGERELRNPNELLHALGFDSFTSYVWIHHAVLDTFPETPYETVFQRYMAYWQRAAAEIDLPYYPNASVGWDSSPRTVQSDVFSNAGYPFTPVLSGATPEVFKAALLEIKARLDAGNGARLLTVNSWNEWTEGSYLEPDTRHGYAYLEALRDVFGIG
jgi:hypothetical protein